MLFRGILSQLHSIQSYEVRYDWIVKLLLCETAQRNDFDGRRDIAMAILKGQIDAFDIDHDSEYEWLRTPDK